MGSAQRYQTTLRPWHSPFECPLMRIFMNIHTFRPNLMDDVPELQTPSSGQHVRAALLDACPYDDGFDTFIVTVFFIFIGRNSCNYDFLAISHALSVVQLSRLSNHYDYLVRSYIAHLRELLWISLLGRRHVVIL